MYEVLEDILVNEFQMRADDVTPAANRVEVGLDSLTVTELSTLLSSRFGIEIHDYELLELDTVGDIALLMEERRPDAAAEPAGPPAPPHRQA